MIMFYFSVLFMLFPPLCPTPEPSLHTLRPFKVKFNSYSSGDFTPVNTAISFLRHKLNLIN